MERSAIERINALARKAKAEGLNPEEKEEQARLRQEYIQAFRQNMAATLDNIYIVDDQGNQEKLKKKPVQ